MELLVVMVIVAILAGVGALKFIQFIEKSEAAAEDATVYHLQAAIDHCFAETLLRDRKGVYPGNPFARLKRVPGGYTKEGRVLTGNKEEDGFWSFVPHKTGGRIYHQRRDGMVVHWAYDSREGVIGFRNRETAT